MRVDRAPYVLVLAVVLVAATGCCRPVCRPCDGPATTRMPASEATPDDVAAARRLIAEDEKAVLYRYFDVKDLVEGSTDDLIDAVRRDVMPEEWRREPPPVIEGRNRVLVTRGPRFLLDGIQEYLRTKRRQMDEKRRLARVVQIHTIADLVVGEAGRDAMSADALVDGIREASRSGSWSGWQHADVRLVGLNALVVKAEPAFQDALDAHLTQLRDALLEE